MSARNVELQRRWIEAYNVGDIEALIAYCDPSLEFRSVFAAVGGAVYHGHDDMRRYFRDLADVLDEVRLVPEAYFDLGVHSLCFYAGRGRGRHSGAEVAMEVAMVARWREDLIVYLKVYEDREDALSDLGVSEDELEPIDP